jgi:putative transcriptional regulator
MSKKAFDQIMEGLNEALAFARGELKGAKLHVPAEIDVRAIRDKLRLSQEDFAGTFGFTIDQIKAWEQGRSRPLGGLRAYLMIIDRDPEAVIKILHMNSRRRKVA